MKKIFNRSEHQEQKAIFEWAAINQKRWPELKYLNGSMVAGKRTLAQQKKAKEAGMKAGKPDINLPVVRGGYAGLYIELKCRYSGSLTKEQKEWLEFLNDQQYFAEMARGSDMAISLIQAYLEAKL